MENNEGDFQNICRICLTPNSNNMVSLFDGSDKRNLSCYGKAVLSFARISITFDDQLPPKMCKSCLFLLKQAIRFKLKCENTHKQLLNILSDQQDRNVKEKIVEYTIFRQYFPSICCNIEKPKTFHENDKKCYEEVKFLESDNEKPYQGDETPDSESDDSEKTYDDNVISETQGQKTRKQMDEDEMLKILEEMVDSGKRVPNINAQKGQSMVKLKGRVKRVKRILRRKDLVKKPVKPVKCEVCQKVLANKSTYNAHKQRHTGFKCICEHCGKGFPTNPELQVHLVATHGTGKYLQCEHCSFKAPRKYDLMEHSRLHTGERPYTCDQCGLTFRRRGIWRKHQVYHEEKSFQCNQCPRRFYVRSELTAHANNVHRRVYVYLCTKCGATYAKAATVRRHMTERHGVPRELQGKVVRINRSDAAATGIEFPEH